MRRLALAAFATVLPLSVVACGDDASPASAKLFCETQAMLDKIQFPSTPSADKVKEMYATMKAGAAKLASVAPAEIKSAAAKLSELTGKMDGALSKAGYDPSKMTDEAKAEVKKLTDEGKTASQQVKDWVAKNCAGASSSVASQTTKA